MHAPTVHPLPRAEIRTRYKGITTGASPFMRARERYRRSHVATEQQMPGVYLSSIAVLEARARAGKKLGEA